MIQGGVGAGDREACERDFDGGGRALAEQEFCADENYAELSEWKDEGDFPRPREMFLL